MRMLFLDLDTLRPDHLGCYGYHRNTSPNIDRIAAEGLRFENYHCSDAPCLPSRAALTTGMFGYHSGAVNHGGTNADLRHFGPERGFRDPILTNNLWHRIRQAGFHMSSISTFSERHSSYWFDAGFNEIYNIGKGGGESAEEVWPIIEGWLDRNAASDNWFLHVNLWDPHTPYRVPEEYGNPFAESPLPAWLTEEMLARHQQHAGPHGILETGMYTDQLARHYPRQPGAARTMEELKTLLDGYDVGIHYADWHVGQILEQLETLGVLEDTIIIVTSDHGENQGELGIYAEHGTADQITTRIPMIIRWPGMVQGVDRGLHYSLDLLPTLAEIWEQEAAAHWDGRSYAATLRDGTDTGREYLVLSQNAHVCQRSVRWDHYIYIRTLHDGYHLFPEEMLFDLEADPHETKNLAEARPDLCGRAARWLLDWETEMRRTARHAEDPMTRILLEGGPFHARGHLPAWTERLERTGRAEAAAELRRRHPGEFCGH